MSNPGPTAAAALTVLWMTAFALAGPPAADAVLSLDSESPDVELVEGVRRAGGRFGAALEFTTPLQYAQHPFSKKLHDIKSMTVGGWFFPRRSGEQLFLFRGLPETGPQGERFFRPDDDWVNFILGTDQRGFFMGTIHGNGRLPFTHVTLNEVPINQWSQLAVVKDARGFQKFYRNGVLVHTDEHSSHAPAIRPFIDVADGQQVRLAMPLGGLIGETWIYARELTPDEIRGDFEAKKDRYAPALPMEPVRLREMNAHAAAGLWKTAIDANVWPVERSRILRGVHQVLGSPPSERVPLDPKVHAEEDCGNYIRRKVYIQVQPDDRMPAYILIPKNLKGRSPAIICFYGTTGGAGKETTVGLSGAKPGSPLERNRAFAIDMVEAGFIAFAPDYLRDGERVRPGRRPYDTTDFYERFPDWSIHGKDAWDTSRAIDYLQTLEFVDPDRIGMVGHSYGGHSTIFAAALDDRIKAAFANGPVSDFRHHGLHWAVPKGAGSSQSLPAMRPFVLDHTLAIPVTFYEFTSLIAPRPLAVGQAVGERRPMEEENHAAVKQVYDGLGVPDRVRYYWYPGDHDFPPAARDAAVSWFRRWLVDARL